MAREIVKKVKVKGPKGQEGYAYRYSDDTFFIEFVRFSHPHIVKPWKKENDKGDPKYSVIAMLGKDTHAKAIAMLEEFNEELLKANKVKKLPADRKYLTDGDEHEDENRAGYMCVSAKETLDHKPPIRGRDGKPLDRADADGLFVGGNYGAVNIRPWYQDSADWGKRINCGLSAAQFICQGEKFGSGGLSEEDLDDTVRSFGDDDDDDDGSYDEDDDDAPKRKPKPKRRSSYEDDDDDDI